MKKRIALLFGGKSAEHEISIVSARNVMEAMDKEKYEMVLIGIDQKGCWYLVEGATFLNQPTSTSELSQKKPGITGRQLAVVPGENSSQLVCIDNGDKLNKIDAVFPILHGPFGEDGTVQGLLKLLHLPFVGPNVLGSAVGMDKDVMKRLIRDAGIPQGKFLVFHSYELETIDFKEITQELGMPLFIKPANLGSSVGINKAHDEQEFRNAINEAFKYDRKIIVEEFIKAREIECAMLGNEYPKGSLPGEAIASHEFYSYEAKYLDDKGATIQIPAKISSEQVQKIQELAVKTFQALCCEGLSRVDFFLTEDGKLLVNEINTIPGFTKVSMYPKMWEATGIPYSDLIDKLIELALERFDKEKKLKTTV